MTTIQDLFAGGKDKGMNFLSDTNPYTSISSVLIKVDDGYPIDIVSIDIRRQIDGIQIIKTQNIISGIAEGIESFSSFLYIFACGCGNTARQLAHLIYCRAAVVRFFRCKNQPRGKHT